MKFTVLSLILTGFLAIPGLSYRSAQPIKNSPLPTTSHLTTSATQAGGKSKICHFIDDQGFQEIFSVVIIVNDQSLDAHFAHGDCFTEAPKGSKNCTCEPPVITLFYQATQCCSQQPLVDIAWTSTGGTSAVLEHRDSVANGGGLIEALDVPTNVGAFNVASFSLSPSPNCGHQFRLVITGPGGTVSRTVVEGDLSGICFI
jgi:hypothetical protein